MDYQEALTAKKLQAENDKKVANNIAQITSATNRSAETVSDVITKQLARSRTQTQPVEVKNSNLAEKSDVKSVVDALNGLVEFHKNNSPKDIDFSPLSLSIERLISIADKLPKEHPKLPEPKETVIISNLKDLANELKPVIDAVKSLDTKPVFDPKIVVKPADVKIEQPSVDLSPIENLVERIESAISSFKVNIPENDYSSLTESINKVKSSIENLKFPVPNYVIPYKSTEGAGTQVQLTAAGAVPVDIQDTTITVVDDTVSTSTDVSLASSASSAQLLASNTSRKGLLLTNTDANTAYIYYGTTASLTKFSAKIPPGAYWEMPQPIYTGRIDAIWDVDGSGSLIGSEL